MDNRDKLKKFCFTLNNYSEAEEQAIRTHVTLRAAYAIVGHEVGEKGTPHLQGYVNLKKQSRFSTIKKMIPRAHIEKARGTDQDNKAYCSKAGNFWEVGELQTAGKRNDLTAPCEALKAGQKLTAVAAANPEIFVKHHRGLEALAALVQKPRDPDNPPVVMWIYGPAGVGKTRFVFDSIAHSQIYMKDSTVWWNGYEQQYCICLDDFDNGIPYRDLLRLLDRYPYQAQIKGGYVNINSPVIIITCEFPPSHYWVENTFTQVRRRLTHVVHMPSTGEFVFT